MVASNPNPSTYDFGPIADRYDQWYQTPEGKRFDALEKRAISRMLGPASMDSALLEIGSGTGWWSRFFSEKGFQVTGIDIAAQSVEIARAKKIPNSTFQIHDAHELPFEEGAFSVSAAITALEFARDPESVVKEMVRCTRRPGGRLVFGVLNAGSRFNRERAEKENSPYGSARLYFVEELFRLLSPYGKTQCVVCAFPASMKAPFLCAPVIDDLAALMKWETGALIATKVEL